MIPSLLFLCSINGTTKPGWQHLHLQHDLLNILSSLFRSIAQEKKKNIYFKIWLVIDSAPVHPRALMELYNEISGGFHAC